jgi:tetratricopeptide (TPR) repeat protein
VLEAKRAYEDDAYLEVAPEIVWRLFYGNFDLENFTQAKEWCDKGALRFPDDYRFVFCELRLMASPAQQPDVKQAWKLKTRIDSLAPAPKKQFEAARGEIFVAGVLARASMRDSAQAVLTRAEAKINPSIDPSYDLYWYEATVRLQLGEKDKAFELMRRGVLGNPETAIDPNKPLEWVYRDMQNYPRLKELYGTSK